MIYWYIAVNTGASEKSTESNISESDGLSKPRAYLVDHRISNPKHKTIFESYLWRCSLLHCVKLTEGS
jgi:hypothetical protein